MPASLLGYASAARCSSGTEASSFSRSVRNEPGGWIGGALPGAGGGGVTTGASATARAEASRRRRLAVARRPPREEPAHRHGDRQHGDRNRRHFAGPLVHHVPRPRHGMRELVLFDFVPFRTLQVLLRSLARLTFSTSLLAQSGHGESKGVHPAGLEPATPGLGNRCSIQLSYGRSRGKHIILAYAGSRAA